MAYSIVQGLTAGGAAAYLHGKLNKEAQDNCSNGWVTGALQVNHLFFLTAENLILAGSPLGMFGSVVRAAPALGVLAAGVSVYRKETGFPLSPENVKKWNDAYRAGVVATSVASLVLGLGNPGFGLASLSMIAVDMAVEGKAKEVFEVAKKVAALCAGVGYGMQIFASEQVFSLIARISTLFTAGKLLINNVAEENLHPSLPPESVASPKGKFARWKGLFPQKGYYSIKDAAVGSRLRLPSATSSVEGNVFTRKSAW